MVTGTKQVSVSASKSWWGAALCAVLLIIATLGVVGIPSELAFANDEAEAAQTQGDNSADKADKGDASASAAESPAPKAAEPAPAPAPEPKAAPAPEPEPAPAPEPEPAPAPAAASASEPEPAPAAAPEPEPAVESNPEPAASEDSSEISVPALLAPDDDDPSGGDSGSGGEGGDPGSGGDPAPTGGDDSGSGGDPAPTGGDDNPSGGDNADDKDKKVTPSSEVPSGSAYVEEIGDAVTFNNTNTDNAIQQAINAAIAKAAEGIYEKNTITVVVKDGTYEGSVIVKAEYTVEKDGKKETKTFVVPEGFKLIIRAKGVLSAEGEALAGGGIGANVTASFNIADMSTEISGLYLSNNNKIDVKGVDEFVFNGTSGNDSATIVLANVGGSTVVLGAGDDTVTVTYTQDSDKPKLHEGTVSGGAGNDAISLDIQTLKSVQKDGVNAYSAITVNGDTGNDAITVKGQSSGDTPAKCAIAINADEGDDLINLDATLHGIVYDTDDFVIVGGEGSDRVNLTGEIAENGLSGDKTALKVWDKTTTSKVEGSTAGSTGALNLSFDSVEAFTDELKGKKEVKLEVASDGTLVYGDALQSFVNYTAEAGKIVAAIFTNKVVDPFLSTLKLAASNIYYIYAPLLNIYDEAVKILVGSEKDDQATKQAALAKAKAEGVDDEHSASLGIYARNVILRGYDDDKNLEVTIPLSDKFVDGGITLDLSMFNFVCKGNVTIAKDAVIDASEFVSLEAKSEQTHGMLPAITNANVVTVKCGNAEIDVLGGIKAGAGVNMMTNGVISITCDGTKWGLPLGVNVAIMDNHIKLDGATIETQGSVLMRTITNIIQNSVSNTGLIPISLSVNVGVSFSDIEVNDSAIKAGGSVEGVSTSQATMEARASMPKDNAAKYESGGFFAVNVAVIEANAIVTGASVINAGGDVRMAANSTVKATDRAISGTIGGSTTEAKKEESTKDLAMGQVTKLAKGLMGKAWDSVKGSYAADGNKISGGFETAMNSVDQQDTPSGDDSGSGDAPEPAGGDSGDAPEPAGGDSGDEPAPSGDSDSPNKSITKIFDTATSDSNAEPGSGTTEASGSETHVVGAVAVTVIVNEANAHIDINAPTDAASSSVTAGGNVALDSSATTMATTIADASTITKTAASKKKDGKTTANSAQLTSKLESNNQIGKDGGPEITLSGGTYTPTNSTIKITSADGWEFINVGGKIESKDGNTIINGGTTTITGAKVDMTAENFMKSKGTLTWKGNAENDDDKVVIKTNGAKVITSDGLSTTTYEGGTVTFDGGTLTLELAALNLEGTTITIKDGAIYLKGSISVDESVADTHKITGKFEVSQVTGGEVEFSGGTGKVARLSSTNVGKLEIVSESPDHIDRTGGTETTDSNGITAADGLIKISEDAGDMKFAKDVNVDIEAGTNYANLKPNGIKDSDGNDVSITFNAGGEDSVASEVILTGDTLTLDSGAIRIGDRVTYNVVDGAKSTEGDTDTYEKAEGKKEMTVYVDGDFNFDITSAKYKGDIAFNNVTFVRNQESQTGNFILKGAETTIGSSTFKVEKGRIVVKGADVKLVDEGGNITITGGTATLELGKATLVVENNDINVEGGKIEVTSKPSNVETTQLGAAVAVSVLVHDSIAYVGKNTTIKANGLRVNAETPMAQSHARSHAGFSNGDSSIAGAITVQVNSIDTKATVEKGANVALTGGDLKVIANANTNIKTVADCSSKTSDSAKDGTGVGAGLAIDVTGIDTIARVEDNTVNPVATPTGDSSDPLAVAQLESIDVSAVHKGEASIEGKAGSSGGTSITPALGLVVAGSTVEAYLGAGEAFEVANEASISAANEVEREVEANAKAAGKDVAAGGAFGIAVYNDSSNSRLKRSVKARKLTVSAKGAQNSKNTSEAGAKGAANQKKSDGDGKGEGGSGGGSGGGSDGDDSEGDSSKSADEQANDLIKKGGALGDLSGKDNVSSDEVGNLTADRQTAETSEGSVSVAAAFALSVGKNEARAEIADGLTIETDEDVDVAASIDTDSEVTANGSATESKIGVGVAVALNIISHDGIARVGDSRIKAGGDLNVVAAQIEDDESDADDAAKASIKDVFIKYMKEMAKNLVDHISKETGLNGFAELLHGTLMDNLNTKLANFGDEIKGMGTDIAKAAAKAVFKKIGERFGVKMTDDEDEGFKAEVKKIVGDVASKTVSDLFDTGKMKAFFTGDISAIVKIAQQTINASLTDIRSALFGFLCEAFGQGEDAPASSFSTIAIAGAGASDVGVAGSVAIAVVNGETKAIIDNRNAEKLEKDIEVAGITTVKSNSVETFETIATAAVTDEGAPDKNEDADESANKGTTTTTKTDGSTSDGGTVTATTESSESSSTSTTSGSDPNKDSGKSVGVGASFAMVYAGLDTIATVGKNRTIETGGLEVSATAENEAKTYSVAGTDPFEDDSDPKTIGIDASVALNIINATTTALFDEGSTLTAKGATVTEGEGADATEEFTNNPVKHGDEAYGVVIAAKTKGTTVSKASGFACGEETAVGAAVAVNIPLSDTTASFKGDGTATGKVIVDASEHNEDDALGTATAMGSDMMSYFKKFKNGIDTIEEWLDKLANGEIKLEDPTKKKGDNKTADKINDVLEKNKNTNEHADGEATSDEDAAPSAGSSLSTNLLKVLDVKTEEKAPTAEGTAEVANNTNQTADPSDSDAAPPAEGEEAADDSSKSVMVAAAIAVNVTSHEVNASIEGSLTGESFDVLATNNDNYRANATGAAVVLGGAHASIGAAVAVGVNNNETHALVNGTVKALEATKEDADWKEKASQAGGVNVVSNYTQNMDGIYAGLLGAQSIAGAASGGGSTATVAGAISILVSNSETTAIIAPNSTVTGGDVVVKAYDKSKLATRAGALMASGGSSVGVGASFALIYGNDIVRAQVGEGSTILAKSLDVESAKAMVTFSDYGVGKDLSVLYEIKPSVKKSDMPDEEVVEAKDQALITITPNTDGDKTTYNIQLNVDTDTILSAIDLLNFLSSTNYYVEAIGGAVQAPSGDAKVNVAGSFAFVFANNTVEALIGDNCIIDLAGDMDVVAECGTNTRIIAGAFSVSGAKVGAGASIAVYADKGAARAIIGKNATVNADGHVVVAAHGTQTDPEFTGAEDEDESPYESSNVLVIAIAPTVSTGQVAVGGVVPVIVMDNTNEAKVLDGATINAGNDVIVAAQTDSNLITVSFAMAFAKDAAVGGTVQVLVDKTATIASVGKNANIVSTDGGVRVTADNNEFLVAVLASLAASKKVGVAAVVNVGVSRSTTKALVDEGALIKAKKDIKVSAESETFMVAVSVGFGAASNAAVGAVVNVFVFDRDVIAQVAKSAQLVSEEGDVLINAKAKDYTVIVAVGGAASGKIGVSGTIPVVVSLNDVKAIVGSFTGEGANERLDAAGTLIKAGGSIGILSDYDTKMYVAAGGFSGAGNVAVGATVLTTVVNNQVLALAGFEAVLTAGGSGAGIQAKNRQGKRKGVIVSATSNETFLAVAVSGAGGGDVAVAGTVNTGVFSNVVHAIIYGGGTVTANEDDAEGDLGTYASSNSNIYLVAGSLDGAGTAGVGATVSVLTYDKDVVASVNAYEPGIVNANDVEVLAGHVEVDGTGKVTTSSDDVYLFAVSISGAGTAAVGAGTNVLYFDNTMVAELGGTVNATGDVTVHADNDSHLINAAGAVAGSGTASVTGLVAVTYFRTSTIARILAGSVVTAGGAVSVAANSAERVDSDTVGITGSGLAAVSGTIAVVVTKVNVEAYIGTKDGDQATATTVNAASVEVLANDDFTMLGIAGTAAVGGVAGVGITAVVAKSNNTVQAYLGKNTAVKASGNVDVKAAGNRDIQMYLATVAGGGTAGVGVTVLVSVVGGNIDQDSADAIVAEEENEDGEKIHFFQPGSFTDLMMFTFFGAFGDDPDRWRKQGLSTDYKGLVGTDTLVGKAMFEQLNTTDLAKELEGDGVKNSQPGLDGADISATEFEQVADPVDSEVNKYYVKDGDDYRPYDFMVDGPFDPSAAYYVTTAPSANKISQTTQVGKSASATDPGEGDVPVISGSDNVRAFVATGSTVTANDISINASSKLLYDAMVFTATGAGVAAVAPSIVVGITHANAAAYTETGTSLTATGDVEVTAWTGSTVVDAPEGSDEAKRNAGFKNQVESDTSDFDMSDVAAVFSGRSVRVVAASGSIAGLAGVSAVVAYLGLDSNAYAYIAGDVTRAHNVTVKADTHFPVAAAATFGLAAGLVGVTASASAVVSNGMVYAGIVGLAKVQNVSGDVNVLSDTDFDATTFTAAIAGGLAGATGSTAISADHMTIHTFVGKGVTLEAAGTLNVKAKANVTSHANIIGGAVGAIAVSIGVAVATIEPTILTYVGTTPLKDGKVTKPIAGADGTNNPATVGALNIGNDVFSKAKALTLGVAVSLLGSSSTNVLVVSNDTLARAGINQKDVTVVGDAVIDSDFSASALTQLISVTAGTVAEGVNTFISSLTADNRSIVDTSGAEVTTGSLALYAGHELAPNQSAATADGVGASCGALAATVNVAVADNDTVNNAEVFGTGTLNVTGGALVVEANGNADARATVTPGLAISGASVASNNAFAFVDATQEARVENTTVNTNGNDVKVISRFNLKDAKDHGAVASVGSNGSTDPDAEINIVGVKVSVAQAKMDGTARAIVKNATLNTNGGAVDVKVDARSYANSDIEQPTVTVSLVGVGIIDSRASAKGTFESVLDLAGENSTGPMTVDTTYDSYAFSATGPVGGVSVGLANMDVNIARATTETTAKAGLTGSGTLNVAGALNVKANGTAKAEGKGRTFKATVGGLRVTVNDVKATQDVTQEAYSTFAGNVVTTGDLNVVSELGNSDNPATATANVGASGSTNVALGGATINLAKTETTSSNKAYIKGDGVDTTIYKVKSTNVKALTNGTSISTALTGTAIGFATVGDLDARAASNDEIDASVSGITLDAQGDVDVIGRSDVVVNATVSLDGAYGATVTNILRAYTDMGSDADKQTVKASVADGTIIKAGGNVNVKAENFGETEGKIDGGKSGGFDSEVDGRFESRSSFETDVTMGENAVIEAGGNVELLADSKPVSKSDARASAMGITTSAVTTYASTKSTTDVTTTVGKNAEITAGGLASIIARGSNKQESETASDASGFVGKDKIKAYLTLTRNITTNVGSGAKIKADKGDISIYAVVGTDDYISNISRAEAGGFAGYSNVRTYTTVDSYATTNIADGAQIEDTFGNVDIYADSSMKYFYNYAKTNSKGVGAEPDALSDTNLTLKSTLNVGEDGKDKVFIAGRNVNLDSINSTMKVIDKTYAKGSALGANVDAHSDVEAHIDNLTKVRNAEIRGYDSVNVKSSANPTVWSEKEDSKGNNVYVNAYAAIYAIGDADAKAYFDSKSTIGTNVDMDTSTIYGASIEVASISGLKYKPYADGYKSSFFASLDKYTRNPSESNSAAKASIGSTDFHVGDAAAGIVIDISGDDADPLIRAVGLRGEREIWNVSNGTVYLNKISNPLKGTLDVTTSRRGTIKKIDVDPTHVYDQSALERVWVNNHTNLDVALDSITVQNENYLYPTVNGVSLKDAKKTSETAHPEITVTNDGTGNVTVLGLIANPNGSVNFAWTDPEKNGSLFLDKETIATSTLAGVAPIWANHFDVKGAASVGTEEKRVNIFATWFNDEAPTTSVHAAGDIWFAITDVKFAPKPDDVSTIVAEPRETGVISDVVSEDAGHTDVLIHTATTIYRDSTTPSIITMPNPGTLEFTEAMVGDLTASVTLNNEALAPYLLSEDANGLVYLLPNGDYLYTDASGVVTRIVEGGLDAQLADFAVTENASGELIAKIGEGVFFNLNNGTIEVSDGSSLTIVLSSIDGEWLKQVVENGGKIVVRDYSKMVETKAEWPVYDEEGNIKIGPDGKEVYETVVMEEPTEVVLTATELLVTDTVGDGSITYYQLTGVEGYSLNDQFAGSSSVDSVFIISYNSSSKKMGLWQTSGVIDDENRTVLAMDLNAGITEFLGSDATVNFQWVEDAAIGDHAENFQLMVGGTASDPEYVDLTAIEYRDGYYYVNSFAAEQSDEWSNADAQKLYQYLYYYIWKMRYDDRILKDEEDNDYSAWVYDFHYVVLSNADGILSTDAKTGAYVLTPDARVEPSYAESEIVLLGPIAGVDVDTINLPEDTRWADPDASSKVGYKISDSLYVATDGTYYLRAATDVQGFTDWFNGIFGDKDFTTVNMTDEQREMLTENITSALLDDLGAFAHATLTEKFYAINLALLEDDIDVTHADAIDPLNDTVTYPAWLVARIANGVTNAQKVLDILDEMGEARGWASDYVSAGVVDQAWFDSKGATHVFDSKYIVIETPVSGGVASPSTVTLKEGQEIYLEVLSPEVAHSIDGRYFVKTISGDEVSYNVADVSAIEHGSETKTLEDETVIDAETESYSISYEGKNYLTVKNYKVDGEVVLIEYLMYDEEGKPVVIVDSEGNVTPVKVDDSGAIVPETESAWIAQKNPGSTYPLSNVAGKTTKITLEDTGETAALVNGDPKPAVIGDEITFVTGEGVAIGSEDDPISVAPYTEGGEVEVLFETLEDALENIIEGEVWLETEGTAVLPDDLTVTEGAEYHHNATLDIIFDTIYVAEKGLLDLDAGRDIIGNKIVGEDDANVTLSAGRDINSEDHYLVIDLPEGNPLHIGSVEDYYIVGVEATDADNTSGRTEDGGEASGTHASDLGGEEFVTGIVSSDVAKLAQWIIDRIEGRQDVIDMLDAAAADPCDEIVAAGDANGLAEWMAAQAEQGTLTNDVLAQVVSALLTDEDLAAMQEEAWSQATYPESDPSALDAKRDLAIEVGESTGSAYVRNLGDIAISQAKGDMTVGEVVSEFGTVTLATTDADAGSILGNADEAVNVQATDVIISATGDAGTNDRPLKIETGSTDVVVIGNAENAVEGTTPKVVYDEATGTFTTIWTIDYDQVGTFDPTATRSLTVTAADNININEQTGDLGVNTVEASGTASLGSVDGSIVDVRADGETKPNVTAPTASFVASAGTVGTTDKPITINTNAEDESLEGFVSAVAASDVNLTETSGDMRVGYIVAGGDANLVVEDGALVDANIAGALSELARQLEEIARVSEEESESAAESARLREETLAKLKQAYEEAQAAADAAQDNADAVASAADAAQDAADDALGKAMQAAVDAEAAQKAADDAAAALVTAEDAVAAAEQVLEEAIASGDEDAIAAAQDALEHAQTAAETAKGIAESTKVTAEQKKAEAEAAEAKYSADQAAADAAKAAADKAQAAADAAKSAAEAAYDPYKKLDDEVENFKRIAEEKAEEAAAARAFAETIKEELENLDASVKTGGDLNVTANAIGTSDDSLITDVGGQLNVNGKVDGSNVDSVNVENDGDLTTGPIAATGDVTLVAYGDIQVKGDGKSADITTGKDAKTSLAAIDGNVGAKADPITVDTGSLTALGNNVYVEGYPNLVVDTIVAEDEAVVTAKGDITDTNDGAGVVAESATITAGGNIGTKDNALDIDADKVTTKSGGDTNIDLTDPLTDVDTTAGGNVDIDSTGSLIGKAEGKNVDVYADGNIGDPFQIIITDANGKGKAESKYGKVNAKITNTAKPTPKPVVVAKEVLVASAKGKKGGKKAKVKWNKISTAQRYVIYIAKSKKNSKKKFKKFKKVKVVKAGKRSAVIKKLKPRTLYKFKVVAQKKVGGKWKNILTSPKSYFVSKKAKKSKKKVADENKVKFKVKTKRLTLKVGKSAKIKAKVKVPKRKKFKLLPTPKKIRYLSADKSIAKVNKKGKVTGMKAGKCTVYVYRINGVWKKVAVTVV